MQGSACKKRLKLDSWSGNAKPPSLIQSCVQTRNPVALGVEVIFGSSSKALSRLLVFLFHTQFMEA